MSSKIFDEKININEEQVYDFFEKRTTKKLLHRYNYVNYQDKHPELALERDKYEKAKILPYLNVKKEDKILDIGCGVGRWGDALVQFLDTGIYVGIDYSKNLIQVALDSLEEKDMGKRIYCVGNFQNAKEILYQNGIESLFDLIIINGLFMYINDADLDICMDNINSLLKKAGRVYIKETVGKRSRYTLNDVYSEELASRYSAIYRSVSEFNEMFEKKLSHFEMIAAGEMYEDSSLNNRKETTSYYWILKSEG